MPMMVVLCFVMLRMIMVVAFDHGELVIYMIVLSHECERSWWSYEGTVYDNGDCGVEFYHRPR